MDTTKIVHSVSFLNLLAFTIKAHLVKTSRNTVTITSYGRDQKYKFTPFLKSAITNYNVNIYNSYYVGS